MQKERGRAVKQNALEILKKYKFAIVGVAGVAAVYAVMLALGITCPIKHFTGVSCFGCGMTRACLSALRLDLAAAFYYHPLWFAVPIAAPLLIILFWKRKRTAFYTTVAILAVALVAVYLYRLFCTEGDVVVWEIEKGMIYQMISK